MKIYFKKGLIYIDSWIEGKTGKEYLPSIIDTGSTITAIKTEILDKIGYSARNGIRISKAFSVDKFTAAGYIIKIDKFKVGDIQASNINVAAFDLIDDPNFPKIDCIIGNNFLRHFKLTIDYKKEELFLKDNQ